MSTYGQMQSNIEDHIDRTDLTSQIASEINRAIHKYAKEQFWFNKANFVITTVAGTQNYSTDDSANLLSSIIDFQYVRINDGSSYYPLNRQPWDVITEWNVNDNQSRPTDYAVFDNAFVLYPIPDNAYTVNAYAWFDFSDLSGAGDSNEFTTIPEAEQLIESEVEYQLYMHLIRDPDAASQALVQVKDALSVLRERSQYYDGVGGKIRATYF